MNYLGKVERLMYRFAKMAFLVNSCLRLIHNLIFCIFLEFAVYYFLQVVLNFNLKKRQFIKSCIPGSVFDQQAAESYFVKKSASLLEEPKKGSFSLTKSSWKSMKKGNVGSGLSSVAATTTSCRNVLHLASGIADIRSDTALFQKEKDLFLGY